jgi:hypothetical protein
MEIAVRNLPARQANRSRMVEVEIRLSEAFAARTRKETKDDFRPRMLAVLTLMVVDLTLFSWFKGDFKDSSAASNYVFTQLNGVFSDGTGSQKSQETQLHKPRPAAKKNRRITTAR